MGLYVVADGMGGAQAGEHASKLATETLWEAVSQKRRLGAAHLVEAFHEANHKVMEAAAGDPALEGMGTTMVAALGRTATCGSPASATAAPTCSSRASSAPSPRIRPG